QHAANIAIVGSRTTYRELAVRTPFQVRDDRNGRQIIHGSQRSRKIGLGVRPARGEGVVLLLRHVVEGDLAVEVALVFGAPDSVFGVVDLQAVEQHRGGNRV